MVLLGANMNDTRSRDGVFAETALTNVGSHEITASLEKSSVVFLLRSIFIELRPRKIQ